MSEEISKAQYTYVLDIMSKLLPLALILIFKLAQLRLIKVPNYVHKNNETN